ncbi:MAG: winged helix-turn-helix transcriptional regulator [Gammaproteobacteria bacterium]
MTDSTPRHELASTRLAAEAALRVLDGQWTVAVLTALAGGRLSFVQLLAAINDVDDTVGRAIHPVRLTRQVLSPVLHRLGAAGLVLRIEETGPPRSVRYELTHSGEDILSALHSLATWAQHHHLGQLPGDPNGKVG